MTLNFDMSVETLPTAVIKLIDFDSAMAVEDYKDMGYERMTLRSLLGVSPEWWDDAVKRARSSKREERIQTRIE